MINLQQQIGFGSTAQSKDKPLPTKKSNPCPVCGDTGSKCRTFAHEPIVLCGNEHSGEVGGYRFVKPSSHSLWSVFAPIDEESSGDDWRRRLEDRDRTNRLKVLVPIQRKPVADRDKEYRSEAATLRQLRRENLKARGLTDSEIDRAISLHLLWDKGAGFAIPALSLTGQIQGCQIARDDRSPKYVWDSKDGSGQLPESGEMPIAYFMHPGCDTTKPIKLLACDAFLKSLVAGIKHWRTGDFQTVFIGAPGCNFQPIQLQSLLDRLKPVQVTYAPDAGDVGNSGMMRAIATFAERCTAAGYEPDVLWWGQVSKAGKDLDDLSRGEIEAAQLLTFAEFLELAPKHESGKGFKTVTGGKSANKSHKLNEPDPQEYARVVAGQEAADQTDDAEDNQRQLDRVLPALRRKKERKPSRARVETIAPMVETKERTYIPGNLPGMGADKFVWIVEPHQQNTFVYEASAKGYENLLNSSGTGAGKSYYSGLLEATKLEFPTSNDETDDDEIKSSPSIWMFSHRSRKPSTKPVEANFTLLPTRHQGELPTGEKTPMGAEVLKPVINPDTPTAGNCKLAHLFVAAGEKNYGASAVEAKDNPICAKCQHNKPRDNEKGSECASYKGEGYGFRSQRRAAMAGDRIRLNPQSAPAKMPKKVLGVFEEIGELLHPKAVKAGISDLNNESAAITDNDFDLAKKLHPIVKALQFVLGGDGVERWGVTSEQLAQLPEVESCLESLTIKDRIDILNELEPFIRLDLQGVLESDGFDNSEEGARVKSLENRARTALKKASRAGDKVQDFKKAAVLIERQIIGELGFVPALEWGKASSIAVEVRKRVRQYWALVKNQTRAECRFQELKEMAIALDKEAVAARKEYELSKDASKKARFASESEALSRLESAPVQVLWDCLNILFFPSEGHGDFRIGKGEITLTIPEPRLKALTQSTEVNLFLDATKNPEILKVELGIDQLLQFRTAQKQVDNVHHFQVLGFGKCGRNRAASSNERLHALHQGIKDKAIAILGTDNFQMETCEYKTLRNEFGAKLGHLQNTRGSNEIAGSQVLVVHGLA